MKFTKREIFLLRESLEFDIHRYLLANDFNCLDGIEKANRHIDISKKIYQFLFLVHFKYDRYEPYWKQIKVIHDYLAEILTDRMDEVIGFPINETCIVQIEELTEKFFQIVVQNLENIKKEVEGSKK